MKIHLIGFGLLLFVFGCLEAYAGMLDISAWKSKAHEKGLSVDFVYTVDYFANTRGGIKRDQAYLSMSEIALELDTEKASLWLGGTFFINVIQNSSGEKLTDAIVGDLQGVSNIAAPRTARVLELWYEHIAIEHKFSVLLGIQDLNSEFYVSGYGGLYLNSSFGMGPEVAGGRPSVFPLAALGIRFKLSPCEQWEFLTAAYDGDPGNPDEDEHFPRFDFDQDGGVFLISEVGYHFGGQQIEDVLPGFIKLGVWHNTGQFADVVNENDLDYGNMGGYVMVDKMLIREDKDQGLGTFLQIGGSSRNVNAVDFYMGGGFNYTGLMPSRDEDVLGIAIARASLSDQLVDAGGRNKAETSVEMTYRAKISEHMVIQPDVQWILNPGANSDIKNALVLGVRCQIAL